MDTNPAKFNAGGRLTIEYYHNKDCDLSTVNLCKGQIVVDHIEKREREGTQYKCVVQVGDGINDFCPALWLSKKDFVCPRINNKLWKKIQKLKSESEEGNDGLKIQAQVVNRTSG